MKNHPQSQQGPVVGELEGQLLELIVERVVLHGDVGNGTLVEGDVHVLNRIVNIKYSLYSAVLYSVTYTVRGFVEGVIDIGRDELWRSYT